MRLIYNVILSFLLIGYLPTFITRWRESRNGAPGFSTRLGLYSPSFRTSMNGERPVWIQAVSMGEVLCIKKLISRFREVFAKERLAISTTTVTGQSNLRQVS